MRIVSLLPSATEIVFALGLDDALVGVSFECDHPPAARTKPVVSNTALPTDAPMTALEIDQAVSTRVAASESLYTLDTERIRASAPDVILAQDLCAVCAVPSGQVEDALDAIGCRAEVVSLDPASLDDVIACIGLVGAATGEDGRAARLMSELRDRLARVREVTAELARPGVLALEWSDPPFSAGHWVPEMIETAGGEALLAQAGERSRRLTWTEIAEAGGDVVAFMPCGYALEAAVGEGRELAARAELASASEIWALAGDAYFSRPGPRVVDGVELLASILHPEVGVRAPSDGAVCLTRRTRGRRSP